MYLGRNRGNGTGERAQQNLQSMSTSGTSVVHGEAEAVILWTVAELQLATMSRLSDSTCNHVNRTTP